MLIRTCDATFVLAALTLAALSPAQTPDPVMQAKVAKALRLTASTTNTAFDASWGPERPKAGTTNLPPALLDRMGGRVTGAFFDDRLAVTFANQEHDELQQVGRHTLARSGNGGWHLRKASFADGNTAEFVPDPPLLLRMLASFDLAVTHAAVGALDDRPVAIASVALTEAQIGELMFAGALPKLRAATRSVGVGAAGRAAAPLPEATVDVAITFDPATGLVHRLQLRTWSKRQAGAAIAIGGAGGRAQVARRAEPEEQAEAAAPAADAPLEYVEGLPVRPEQGMMISNFDLRLHEHGQVAIPALDEQQQRLLGR